MLGFRRRHVLLLAAGATMTASLPAQAATPSTVAMARGGGALPPVMLAPQPPSPKRFTFDAGADFVSRYIARGEAFSDEPSFQPYFSVGVSLPELTNETVKQVRLVIGNWDSLQSGNPGLGQANYGDLKGWYESDFYGAATATFSHGWSGSLAYYFFHSPAHSFGDYGNVEAIIRYDDTKLWKGVVPLREFALKPQLRVTRDVGRNAGDNATYVQPSLTPSFALGDGKNPVRIGIPLVFGFSDKYYSAVGGGHASYGYFRTGIDVNKTLVKREHFTWRLAGGVAIWFTNDKVANGLANTEAVARIATSWNF